MVRNHENRGTARHAVGLMDAVGSTTVQDGERPFEYRVTLLLLEHATSYGGPRMPQPDVHVDGTNFNRAASQGVVPRRPAC